MTFCPTYEVKCPLCHGKIITRRCLCSVCCACCLHKIGCVGTKENRATTVYQPRLKCINICIQTEGDKGTMQWGLYDPILKLFDR